MVVPDFFHCNACFSQPGPKSSKFFLTNCGHSFCYACLNNTNVPQCRVCKASCKTIPLTNDLPEDLKLYFGDMVQEVKHLLKVLVIQNKHCKIYMEEYATKLEASYAENRRELSKVKTELAELKKRYQELGVENQVLKKNASNLQMTQVRNKSPFGLSNFNGTAGRTSNQRGSAFLTPSPTSISGNASNIQMTQVRNKSPFGLSNFSGTAGRTSHQRGSAFLTPSPSSISGSSAQCSQGRSAFSTPGSLTKKIVSSTEKTNFKTGFRQSESLTTSPRSSIPPLNSQPFVLSSQPLQTQYDGRSSRGGSTQRSWSSGSGTSSRNTSTKTIRKSRDSFISKLNNSNIF